MTRRRRLNKKVALIGTAVFLLFALAAVGVLLHLNRNPAPLIADGDAAWAAKDYETARRDYTRAYGLIKSSEGKIELLFKLADLNKETNQWDKVLGCWNAIITSDPQNVKARLGQLKYSYIQADGLGSAGRSMSGSWEDVLSQARETMKVIERSGLGNDEKAKWEPAFGAVKDRTWSGGAQRLGPHLHFIKGRAAFELARMGAVTSPGELLQEAESDLQEARKLDPNNAQVYRYLAEVFVRKGEAAASRGSVDQKDAAERQADDILAEAMRAAGDVPETHINVLTRKLTVAQRGGITAAREQMKALEPQYEDLAKKFAASSQVFAALGQFYSFYAAYLDSTGAMEKLNRAIQATEQARTLDSGNVEYAMLTASYHYRKFSVYGDVPALNKAIDLTAKALELPDAQDTAGPTQFAKRVHRLSLCSLLAKCCVERILALPKSDPTREGLLAQVEKAVHEIGQMQGSGEDPDVVKWQGMLDLARGQTDKAIRNLYAAYEQIKAANPPEQRDPFLSYTLAKIFEPTTETGAVIDFLGTALSSGIVYPKPGALLDYGHVLLRAGSYDAVLSIVDSFEERFGGNNRSKVLRIKALIAEGRVTEAEEGIAKLSPSDPNAIVLSLGLSRAKSNQLLAAIRQQESSGREGRSDAARTMTADLGGCLKREAELVQRLLQIDPGAIEKNYVAELCESLIAQGDTGAAKTIVEALLKHTPDDVTALFYRGLLSEADPRSCPPSRRKEIQEQAARAIADPVRRSLELGLFYLQTQQPDKAASQLQSVLDATASQSGPDVPAYVAARPLSPRPVAASHLFDLARSQENWSLAGRIAEIAKRENLDDCGGHLFAANLASARKEYESALTHLDECLKQRPIFSYGYVLRSDVKAALGREQESIEDAQKASSLNPMDPLVAKTLAKVLYARNTKLGGSLSSDQRHQTRQALERAIQLDPRDPGLLNVYVDFISNSEPEKAVALRQTIQANAPSADNAVMLGELATQVALKETDPRKKKAFFTMAQTAFEQAIDTLDNSIRSAGPETDSGLAYATQKAQVLTTAYNATSDKVYLQKAIAVYESLRLKWPKNSSVLNNLAYMLAQNDEKLAEALEYAQAAIEQDPDQATYLDTYAYVLYKNGKHAQAAQSLAAALQKYEVRGTAPTDVYEHLGMVQEALGDRSKALDAYRRALEVGGTAMPEAVKKRIDSAIERLTK
jgi:tetratricopeptide (TPR) repeat protein